MKLSSGLALVCVLLSATPAAADIETQPFTVLTFPSIPDPGIYGPPQPGLYVLVGGSVTPTGISNNGLITGYFPQRIGPGSRIVEGIANFGFVDAGGSYAAFYGFGTYIIGLDESGTPVSTYRTFEVPPAGINNSGTIVGNYYGDAFFDLYGFSLGGVRPLYGADNYTLSPISYPNLTFGLNNTTVSGINDSGDIVGSYSDQALYTSGGFLLRNGIFTPLPYFPISINDNGQILGRDSNGHTIIDTNGSIRDLGVLPFTPTGFNDSDTIVGGDYLYRNGSVTQMVLPGLSNVQINAINDSGSFVGTGIDSTGQIGFESQTPEPFAGLPLLVGVLGIAGLTWKKGRQASAFPSV